MRLPRTLPIVFALAALLSLPARAANPDLSGVWKLNLARSFLAGDHAQPNFELTRIIEQRGSGITQTDIAAHAAMMNFPLPDSRTVIQIIFDGREHDAIAPSRFAGIPPGPVAISASWEGGTLVVTEIARELGAECTMRLRYFLAGNGRELIVLVEAHSHIEDREQRLVFDRLPQTRK
jgi:hypothetical protein